MATPSTAATLSPATAANGIHGQYPDRGHQGLKTSAWFPVGSSLSLGFASSHMLSLLFSMASSEG